MKLLSVIIVLLLVFGFIFLFHLMFAHDWDELEVEYKNYFLSNIREQAVSRKLILVYSHLTDTDESAYPILQSHCLDSTGLNRQKLACPYSCIFTDEKSTAQFAHAVVFSARTFQSQDYTPIQQPGQYWVILNWQSPIPTFKSWTQDADISAFDGLFNWTMGYHRSANIRIPFGRVLTKHRRHLEFYKNPPVMKSVVHLKKKLMAWVSSENCQLATPGRNQFINSILQHIPIDIYGNCGPNKCSFTTPNYYCYELKACYEDIGPMYKFHLALEDAFCDDYVTDKFFNALEVGMVPVVLGRVNYSDIAVPGSFIDARDFDSAEDLARYLKFLDQNEKEYLKFFEWRQKAYVTQSHPLDLAWCSLCAKLWDPHFNVNPELLTNQRRSPVTEDVGSRDTVSLSQLKKLLATNDSGVCDDRIQEFIRKRPPPYNR